MPESERREPIMHEQELIAEPVTVTATLERSVKRGLNGIRLAVLGILVGIGLTVGFGVPGPIWVGVIAGAASFALACLLIRWEPSQRTLMAFMHWLTES